MPFKSEKQRKYMWAKQPEIARKWTKKYNTTTNQGLSRAYKDKK